MARKTAIEVRPWTVKKEMPLSGRLQVLVRSFGLGRAIEFQDRVDTDFPDSLGDGGPLCADGEFALVFVAAEFAFDGHMRAFVGLLLRRFFGDSVEAFVPLSSVRPLLA